MTQITIRLDEALAGRVKAYAGEMGRSVNSWVVAVLRAAVDPDLAESETERTRARLAAAGLLAPAAGHPGGGRPSAGRLRRARSAAGGGTPLSSLISDGRG